VGHPSVSWKSTSRKVRGSQASFSSGRSRHTPSKTGTASGGASSDSSARASMGAHYRHTTPEMAARVVTAIRARLTVLVHAAEDTLERSRPTCHAPCSDSYGPRFLANPWQAIPGKWWFGAFGACGPPAGRGHSTHDQPGGDQRCRLDRGRDPAGERLTGSVDDPLTHLGDRLDRICWASLERPPRLAATMVSSPLGGTSASSSPANSTAPLAWTTTTSGVTDCSWTG
jgi:hypothetical protein